jgi:hypothetical protein
MDENKIVLNPLNKVILEDALDELVEKIGGKDVMYIRMREIRRERLFAY